MPLLNRKNRKVCGVCLLLGAALCITSCSLFLSSRLKDITRSKDAPAWEGKFSRTDLSPYLDELSVYTGFAENNERYVLVRSYLDSDKLLPNQKHARNFEMRMRKYTVLDFEGKPVNAVEKDGALKKEFADMFPRTFLNERFRAFTEEATEYWEFSKDSKKVVKANCPPYPALCDIGLWDTDRNNPLWNTKSKNSSIGMMRFVRWNNEECILVAFLGVNYQIFSSADGRILREAKYPGPPTIGAGYAKRFGDDSYRDNFYSRHVAYDEKNRLVACCHSYTRRVRVFSIDSPDKLICELNSCDLPDEFGAGWHVEGLKFNGNGRYLIIEYSFGGTYTFMESRKPTEVYDTKTWQLCWSENSTDIEDVAISPDGSKISFVRIKRETLIDLRKKERKILEIGDFIPKPAGESDCNNKFE